MAYDQAVRAHKFKIPITTEDDLREYIRLAWGVVIPDRQVCAHHTTPWRAFCDAYFAKHPVTVWKGSRGFGGKSFTLAVLGATEASTLKADVSILGGSGAQSLRVHEHMSNLWHAPNAPRHLLKSDPSTERTQLKFGNKVVALMASQASVRGPHPQRMRMDEIDEMDISILDAATGQAMEGNTGIPTQTVMSSTHQYAAGTMTEILKRANEKGWPVYEWCHKETSNLVDGWLSKAEIDRKRSEVTSTMWDAEYDLQAPNPGSRAIMSSAVEALFIRGLGEFAGNLHEYVEIEPPLGKCSICLHEQPYEFTTRHQDDSIHRICQGCSGLDTISRILYIHGADWARKSDFSIFSTFRADKFPLICVAWQRSGRLEWPVMIHKFVSQVSRYGGRAAYDATGLGDVVGAYLPPTYEGIVMAGQQRAQMLTSYIAEIEAGHLQYPMIKYAYTEHLNAGVEDVFSSGESYHLPDTISSGALALTQIARAPTRLFVAKSKEKAHGK